MPQHLQQGALTPATILDEADSLAARTAARAIGEHLAALPPTSDPALSHGGGGRALLYAWLATAFPSEPWRERAVDELERAIAATARPLLLSLYLGLTGVGMANEVVQRHLFGEGASDDNDAIDDALVDALSVERWTDLYGLTDGLAGFGLYALERGDRPAARRGLELVVAHLDDLAERRGGLVTWRTPSRHVPRPSRAAHPEGWYCLGLAHGVPGVVAVLALAAAAGIERALPLAIGSVRWLLEQRLVDGALPATVSPDGRVEQSRTAWCYGEPGAAAALLVAARALNERAWEREAVALALLAADRAERATGVVDASLCHGSAGLSQIFLRLHRATGEPRFAEAARGWALRTLRWRGAVSDGIAGYRVLDEGQERWVDSPALRVGAAGIALSLLAAATNDEDPSWDRVLLLSPPRP